VRSAVHYIPIATTLVALIFARALIVRWRARRSGPHLLWWAAGALTYAAGTFTEATVTLAGWSEGVFRLWYITGALLGGAPLAQGTVYLFMKRRTAHFLTAALVTVVVVAATCVLLSPVNHSLAEPYRLSGRVLEWQWVRGFSPFINSYALVFLVGGAVVSALRYARRSDTWYRAVGNALIATGALLPGIGGAFTRFGHVEVLYVTEFVGLALIIAGYRHITATSRGADNAGVIVPA
jgi:hypothetical protein